MVPRHKTGPRLVAADSVPAHNSLSLLNEIVRKSRLIKYSTYSTTQHLYMFMVSRFSPLHLRPLNVITDRVLAVLVSLHWSSRIFFFSFYTPLGAVKHNSGCIKRSP